MKELAALFALALSLPSSAQLVNGSFESDGQWDLTGWTAPCQNAFFGGGQTGNGDYSLALPHGETNGSCYASTAYQLVPSISNGSVWTLSGWCHNFATGFSDPYIGIGMGVKHADGWWEYFTAPVMNTGNWTLLSVTNSFTLLEGDTAFVICDAGIVSGFGTGAWSEFDGLGLTSVSTGVRNIASPANDWRYDATAAQWQVNLDQAGSTTTSLFDLTGRLHEAQTKSSGSTLAIDAAGLSNGIYLLRMRTGQNERVLRLVKN